MPLTNFTLLPQAAPCCTRLYVPAPQLSRFLIALAVPCTREDSARFVDHTLVEDGYITANYHGAVPANTRAENFEDFCEGRAHVLVTTDLAARGLDR